MEVLDRRRTRDEFLADLDSLRRDSNFSYKALGRAIDRPTTTVHGWFSGRHLPYQRDIDSFQAALKTLGVADTKPWLNDLAALRQGGGISSATADRDPASAQFMALVMPLERVNTVEGSPPRLSIVTSAAEEMCAALLEFADDDSLQNEVAANALRLSDALRALAAMTPPPLQPLEATMLEASRLLERHQGTAEDLAISMMTSGTALASAASLSIAVSELSTVLTQLPHGSTGTDWEGPLGRAAAISISISNSDLSSEPAPPNRAGSDAEDGLATDFSVLAAGVIKASPLALARGIGWLADQRSWVGAIIRFAIGIVRSTL